MADEKEPPTIIMRVTDRENFEVEVDYRVPNPEYALLMLETSKRALERQIRAMEAKAFRDAMATQSAVAAAMQKGPRII